MGEFIGRVLVYKNIISAWEQPFKGDKIKVRPMVRCLSVPLRLFMQIFRISRTYVLSLRSLL